jgi:DNA-binding PucR family transcriptional regulator
LASRDDTTRRLGATVRAYLDENGSRGRTAKRLHVHENTVAYRLRQAEELLGRSVEKRTLELRVALALADLVNNGSDTNRSAPAGNMEHDVPGTIGLSTSPQTS